MTTLKDRLLNGKVIGETFNIFNPEMLGEDPVENYHYIVRDLGLGKGCLYNEAVLIADGEDDTRNEYPLPYRLEDQLVEPQKEQKAQTPTPKFEQSSIDSLSEDASLGYVQTPSGMFVEAPPPRFLRRTTSKRQPLDTDLPPSYE